METLAAEFGEAVEALAADVSTESGATAVADHVARSGRFCRGVLAAAGGLAADLASSGE